MHTLLLTPETLDGATATVEGEAYRHLFRAARVRVGDALRVVDGAGRARSARVERVDRRRAALTLGEPAPSLEPPLAVELFVAAPRPQRAAWLVEKATEVGCRAVRFLATERSPRRFGGEQIERLGRVAAAAVEQCGRARVPAVSGPHEAAELEELVAALPRRLALDPEGAGGWGEAADTALFVGPEGGWTPVERRLLADLGCRRVELGPRILRVETAAVVGAARVLLR